MTLGGPVADCPVHDGSCSAWIYHYLKDCVCNTKDTVSFALGLLSVFSWGVAEIPQIITNFQKKSTEGLSLTFLMTWVVGDVFNLFGCYIEPATLPTQFYMALLYTLTTLVLVGQLIYYDYILASRNVYLEPASPTAVKEAVQEVKPALQQPLTIPEGTDETKELSPASSQPTTIIHVPLPRRGSRDMHFTSARSLASSQTPTGSYLFGWGSGSGGQNSYLRNTPSYGSLSSLPRVASAPSVRRSTSDAVLRALGSGVLMVGGFGLRSGVLGRPRHNFHTVAHSGRKLLQHATRSKLGSLGLRNEESGMEDSMLGEIFGWCMAAIYMGGRLPQIWLNMTRGTVEGLSPLMFLCALLGNTFYVGSILVRSMEWPRIKPNMPWLVDAAVCVVLDCFILCQFVYYTWIKRPQKDLDDKGEYALLK